MDQTPKSPQEQAWEYLKTVRQNGKSPNFWMSEEYLQKSELEWRTSSDGQLGGWSLPEDDGWFFPPILRERNLLVTDIPEPIYAGFVQEPSKSEEEVLDRQYIYNPPNFLSLRGKLWRTYRKNIRKFPERHAKEQQLSYRRLKPEEEPERIEEMLLQWTEGKAVQDPDTMVAYFLFGECRFGLFVEDRLVGVNIADTNWKFINFRYCLDDGTPFLNEYLRHCFYVSPWVLDQGKYVNDGGDLDNSGLARYKKKLNPVAIHQVPTYRRGGEN